MAEWKGVELPHETLRYVRYMESVDRYREQLQSLQAVWDNLTVLGQLSGTGTNITGMRHDFGALTGKLVAALAEETRRKVADEITSSAQVAIDILVRNLFERTADIGFLATDDELSAYVQACAGGERPDASAITERMSEYVQKYSVYDDVILLDTDARVLARLDRQHQAVDGTDDAYLRKVFTTREPYLERFGPCDLMPGAGNVLLYAAPIRAPGGRSVIGALVLSFRIDDECTRIFSQLRQPDDWQVVAICDHQGRVVGSSDPYCLPTGAPLTRIDRCGLLRFAGREYMAVSRPTRGYQGYMGPQDWFGIALVPTEHAFDLGDEQQLADIAPGVVHAVMESQILFSHELQEIPRRAEAIQRELNRAVWNGNVRQSRLQSQSSNVNSGFAKTLLWEISNTGSRTKDIFASSITNLRETVVSSILSDCSTRAAQAIDIMDRNLYERANDCRWWALTGAFREAMAEGKPDAATCGRLGEILAGINALYTVYTSILLYDRNGTVLATSSPANRERIGQRLPFEWVGRSLALRGTNDYCVSAFEPSELYDGRATYIYCAAVRAPDSSRVVGGIALVFDSDPQFRDMLSDTLSGAKPGAQALFIDHDGMVISSNSTDIATGSRLELSCGLSSVLGDKRSSTLLPHARCIQSMGTCQSLGYREYKSAADSYRNDITAIVLAPLTGEGVLATADVRERRRGRDSRYELGANRGDDAIELATFYIAGRWYGLRSADIIESIDLPRLTQFPGLPEIVAGVLMYNDQPLAVFDMRRLLNHPQEGQASQIVVARNRNTGNTLGLMVDELGEIPEVPADAVQPVSRLFARASSVADSIVKIEGGRRATDLLMMLSLDQLAQRISSEGIDLAMIV